MKQEWATKNGAWIDSMQKDPRFVDKNGVRQRIQATKLDERTGSDKDVESEKLMTDHVNKMLCWSQKSLNNWTRLDAGLEEYAKEERERFRSTARHMVDHALKLTISERTFVGESEHGHILGLGYHLPHDAYVNMLRPNEVPIEAPWSWSLEHQSSYDLEFHHLLTISGS